MAGGAAGGSSTRQLEAARQRRADEQVALQMDKEQREDAARERASDAPDDEWLPASKSKARREKPAPPKPAAAPEPRLEEEEPKVEVDRETHTFSCEARRLGYLIGPKGATKQSVQDKTGTDIVMPKTERDFVGMVDVFVVRFSFSLCPLCPLSMHFLPIAPLSPPRTL